VAVTVADPALTPVTFPEELTVATEVSDELQVTDCVELLGVTVAVSVADLPLSMERDELSSDMDVVAMSLEYTVTAHVPLTDPDLAVMVAEPVATAVTTPELDTVATDVLLEDHVTLWSAVEGETVAARVEVPPTVKDTDEGLIETEVAVAAVTVTLHVALLESAVAVMVAVPVATAVIFPEEFTVATDLSEVDQLTVPFQLLGDTVAVRVLVSPASNETLVASSVTDTSSLLLLSLFPDNPNTATAAIIAIATITAIRAITLLSIVIPLM